MKSVSAILVIATMALTLTGCDCFDWCNPCYSKPCAPKTVCRPVPRPCCCPQPYYCGRQPIDYCTPGYYQYFDAD
jgi:hypothetical protein